MRPGGPLRSPAILLGVLAIILLPAAGSAVLEGSNTDHMDATGFETGYRTLAPSPEPVSLPPPPAPVAPTPPAIVGQAPAGDAFSFTARSGGVTRSVNLQPLVPSGVSFGNAPLAGTPGSPAAPAAPAGVPRLPVGGVPISEDVIVTVQPRPLGGGLTVIIAVRQPGTPLDIVVQSGTNHGGAYVGFAAAQAPAHMTLVLEPRDGGLLLDAITTSPPALIEVFGGRGLAETARVVLSPVPERARVDLSLDPNQGGFVWEADRVANITVSASTGTGVVTASARELPGAVSLRWGPWGARWNARAAATSLDVDVTGVDGARFALGLAPVPTTASVAVSLGDDAPSTLTFRGATPIDRAHVLIGANGTGVHVEASGVPRSVSAAWNAGPGEGSVQVDAGPGVDHVVATIGRLDASCSTRTGGRGGEGGPTGSGVVVNTTGPCTRVTVPGLARAAVSWNATAFALDMNRTTTGPGPFVVLVDGDLPVDARLAKLPAGIKVRARLTGNGSDVHAEVSERTHLAGSFGRNPPPVRAGGWAFRSEPAPAASFDLEIPQVLDLILANEPAPPRPGPAKPPATFAMDAARWPDAVAVRVTTGAATRVEWSASEPVPGTALSILRDGFQMEIGVSPAPRNGWVRTNASHLSYAVDAPTDVRVDFLRGDGSAVGLPAAESGNHAAFATAGDAMALRLRLAGAPRSLDADWQTGLRVEYADATPAPLIISTRTDGRAMRLTLPVPERVSLAVSTDGDRTTLRAETPAGMPRVAATLTDALGRESLVELRQVPASFALRLGGSDILSYEASAPGMSVEAGGDGDALGLGAGGALSLPGMPANLTIRTSASGLTVDADDPLTATLRLGDARWGSAWLGFGTRGTTLTVRDASHVAVDWGLAGADIRGDTGTVRIDHVPRTAAGHVALAGWGSAKGGLDTVSVDLDEGDGYVLYAQNVHTVAFDIAPPIGFAFGGATAGAFLSRMRHRKARNEDTPPQPAT